MAVATSTFDSVFVTATDVTYTASDEIKGVRDLSVEETRTVTDSTYLGDAFNTFTAGVKSVSLSMSGHFLASDTAQKAVRDGYANGTTVYLHIIDTPSATVGQRKGTKYPVYVESLSLKYATGDVVAFDAKFALAAAPTSINA